jgi:hypothetical protein
MYPLFLKKKGGASGPDPNALINEASFKFLFANRTLVDSVSSTSPLTVSRPGQKFAIDQNGRYAITAASTTTFQHTEAGVCQGVLIEGASSNYIRNSNVFTGSGGWDVARSGSPAGVSGGGQLLNLTPTAGLPGPVLGLENTTGYRATRFTMTATTGQHYVGKYGGYGTLLEQHVIAIRQNGNTTDYALSISAGGLDFTVGFVINAAGQILRQPQFLSDPLNTFSNIHFLNVRQTSDGWSLISFALRASGTGNNDRNPQIGVVKRNGTGWDTSFAGDAGFTFDLFGFSREYSASQASRGAERLYSSYIHTNAATGPVSRSADSLIWSSISASLRTVFIEATGSVYDCSLLTIDDNSGSAYTAGMTSTDTAPYEPDNMIDFRVEASGGMDLNGTYKCVIRRGLAVTASQTTDVFTTAVAHGLSAGMQVSFRPQVGTTLPSPLVGKLGSAEQLYYVLSTNLTSTTFMVSTVANGPAVDLAAAITSGVMVRTSNTVSLGSAPTSGTQRMIVSWDATNVACGSSGASPVSVPHGLGAAPTLTHMRFGTGFRLNRLADLNQPITQTIGWARVLNVAEQAALLRQP